MPSRSKSFNSWDWQFCTHYLLFLSGVFLLCLTAVWCWYAFAVVHQRPSVWDLLWLAFLGLVLGYQFLLAVTVVKSVHRIQSEQKMAGELLLLEYLNCSAQEAPEWVQNRLKHPAFAQNPWGLADWNNVGQAVSYDLDRYEPKKNAFLGLILIADEAVSKLPLPTSIGRQATTGSSRILLMKELDKLIDQHLAIDIRQLYPKEVYHLRMNFLRDYWCREDDAIYDENDDESKPWHKRWYWLYGYDLPEELSVLYFCQHCLAHLRDQPPIAFDEQKLRERFAEVHEEYCPDNMQRVGGSWLRPQAGFRGEQPSFTFRLLAESEEAILERITDTAQVGLMFGHTKFQKRVLGERDEEVKHASKTIWKFCGSLPEEVHTRCPGVKNTKDTSAPSHLLEVDIDMVAAWQEYKKTKHLLSCPHCHELGLKKNGDAHAYCPHCQHEF